jgi:hypothetical protein
MLSALALELFTVHALAPGMILRASLYAIKLADDPEAFFSSQGALSRFSGSPLPSRLLEELGSRTGISKQQIAWLLAEQPGPEPGD